LIAVFIPFILAVTLSLISQSLYNDRFFAFTQLYVVIILAAALTLIPAKTLRLILVIAVAIAIGGSHLTYWQELDIANKPGAHAATRTIFRQLNPGEAIIVSSPFIYFAIEHYAKEEYNGTVVPKLYSNTGDFSHFSGGPILTDADFVGPSVYTDLQSLWVVDTTGFGALPLILPPAWQPTFHQSFPEVFPHQGEVQVTRYSRVL